MPLRRSSYLGYPVNAQGKVATVAWDPDVAYNSAWSGEWTSCAAVYPGSPLSGSFVVYNQASSIIVYGWKANGSQPIVFLDGNPAKEVDTEPSEDEINMFESIASIFRSAKNDWVQFSVTFPPLINEGGPVNIVLADGSVTYPSDESFAPTSEGPTLIFQNVTVFYAPVGSVGNGGANPTYDSGQPEPAPTVSHGKAPAMGQHRSSAAVIVLAVVVPVVAVAVVALAVSWLLRYRRLLGPSVVPQVPIDETRRPSRTVAEKY